MIAAEMDQDPEDHEKRAKPRSEVNGSGHVILPNGLLRNVRLIDLSAGGAHISRPTMYDPLVGDVLVLAGELMPWERKAVVVAISPLGLHLRFE